MRRRTLKIVLPWAVVAGLGCLVLFRPAREPTYNGKTASAWFRLYCESRQASPTVITMMMPTGPRLVRMSGDPDPEALAALRALGSNAVAYLAATIQHSDSRFDQVYWRVFGKVPPSLQGLLPKPIPRAWLASEAAAALAELGPEARSAIPTLAARWHKGRPLLDGPVREALVRLRPRFEELAPHLEVLVRQREYGAVTSLIWDLRVREAETVPLLIRVGEAAGEPGVRRTVMMLLEQQGPNAAPAVPLLVTALGDPDSEVRYLSARTLSGIGTNARPSLEALKRACSDTNVMVQNASRRAIRKIAPDADHSPLND